MNNAFGQKTSAPRAASTMYCRMDDDEDVLAVRPTPIVEVRPQPGVLRHTAEQIIETFVPVQVLDTLVPQLGSQVVELLQKIDAPALVEQVIAVPKISLDRTRSALRVVVRGGQNSWWKCHDRILFFFARACGAERRHSSWSSRSGQWGEVFKVHMVVLIGLVREAFKVSPRDRVQQRSVEQISMRLFTCFFALFLNSKKVRGWVPIRSPTGCGLFSMDSGGLRRLHGTGSESESEVEEDAETRFEAGFRPLRVCTWSLELHVGRPVRECAYGDRCTYAQ